MVEDFWATLEKTGKESRKETKRHSKAAVQGAVKRQIEEVKAEAGTHSPSEPHKVIIPPTRQYGESDDESRVLKEQFQGEEGIGLLSDSTPAVEKKKEEPGLINPAVEGPVTTPVENQGAEEEPVPQIKEPIQKIDDQETSVDKLLKTYDEHMDTIVQGVKEVNRTLLRVCKEDGKFTEVREKIKELFSHGIIPCLEDVDRTMKEFFPDIDEGHG